MGIGVFFLFAFNNQHAVLAPGVFRLVPLFLLVADESVFVIPLGGVRAAVLVELVVPDEFVIGIIRFFHHPLGFFDAVPVQGVKLGMEGGGQQGRAGQDSEQGGSGHYEGMKVFVTVTGPRAFFCHFLLEKGEAAKAA